MTILLRYSPKDCADMGRYAVSMEFQQLLHISLES